ncbi:ATP-binding protein [bacterium]|nr:ATP-binding protein [bacterium]
MDKQWWEKIRQKIQKIQPPSSEKPKEESNSLAAGLITVQDIIAPSAIEVDFTYLRINNRYYRTFYVVNYPRYVSPTWLAPLINFDQELDIAMYIYPSEEKRILEDLKKTIAQMEAEISIDTQRGKVVDPVTQAKLEDALLLQEKLAKGIERFFQFGLYITISSESLEQLNRASKELQSSLGALMIVPKQAMLEMEEGFRTVLPLCHDELNVTRNMDTTALATTFPFVSSELSDEKGIMYGINEHNGSLVIFDRFSMENYNSVIFAKSGAGKSYLVKLEVLRQLMFDTEVIVIDPENEYRTMCQALGGQYITFGFSSPAKINPFDLEISLHSPNQEENELSRKVLSLYSLFRIIMGKMTPQEEAILDRALIQTYKNKGITMDPSTQQGKEMPLMEDLYKVLIGMEEEKAASLAARLEKFIKGAFAGLFNAQTNVNIKNKFVVFGIRDLEEALRPIAMHIILDFIWNKVRQQLKKRILVVDEAWYLMRYPDSARFLYGIAKRARKYYLGLTTITQDVDDFLGSKYGGAIVKNSSMQILLKQHPAAIDQVGDIFYLSQGERQFLLSADVGEGIFFAGQNHVAIKIIASPQEHKLITSNPAELIKRQQPKSPPQNPPPSGKLPERQ